MRSSGRSHRSNATSRRTWTEVGDLKAKLLLDFFLGEIGPIVYNSAIADAQAYFQGKVADLEGSCYEAEFGYWP